MIQNLKKFRDRQQDTLATKNLVPNQSVYGEERLQLDAEEYRLWNPLRSKLSAAILLGAKTIPDLYQKKNHLSRCVSWYNC